MKFNTKKVINEINKLIESLKMAIKEKNDFEDIHNEILVLCETVLPRQRHMFRSINKPFPSLTSINFHVKMSKNPLIKPSENPIFELARKDLDVLNEAKSFFSSKSKLESKIS